VKNTTHHDSILLRIPRTIRCVAFLTLVAASLGPAVGQVELPRLDSELERIYAGHAPKTADDLRQMQRHQLLLAEKVIAATVSVRVGNAFGSGVIVSHEGLILTAAHVAGEPGRNTEVRLADGRVLGGISLGVHRPLDAGMLRITDPTDIPYLKVRRNRRARKGQWCAACGHPGGYSPSRGPVFRLGRVLNSGSLLRTDCQLAGGDSGGPLVNMDGEVIGIHSRIGISLANNLHTPTSVFDRYWDGLVAGDVWKGPSFLGVRGDRQPRIRTSFDDPVGAVISFIHEDSPAEDAGLEIGDIVTRFGGQRVYSFSDLVNVVQLRQPGERVDVDLIRDGEPTTVEVRIGRRRKTATKQS
jgi:serine protease Do